jgi:hypothetical protein
VHYHTDGSGSGSVGVDPAIFAIIMSHQFMNAEQSLLRSLSPISIMSLYYERHVQAPPFLNSSMYMSYILLA